MEQALLDKVMGNGAITILSTALVTPRRLTKVMLTVTTVLLYLTHRRGIQRNSLIGLKNLEATLYL